MEAWLRAENRLTERRAHHWQRRLDAMLRTELMRRARRHGLTQAELDEHAARVASGQEDPWRWVAEFARTLFHQS
jgi:hypothetical protein